MAKKVHVMLALFLILSVAFQIVLPNGVVKAAETKNLVILGTADVHGSIDGYDYFGDKVSTGIGLTRVETYVKQVKATNPNTILIDNGDTIQGTPLVYYAEVLHPEMANPMAAVMNGMGYVSATVGNHEFNFGPTVFNKYKAEATFPLLSANVTGCRDYTFTPYIIQDVDGVQVGILGLTPPAVPHWERPENIVGCVFGDAVAAAASYVPQMKAAGADVIVVAAHSGLDETYGYGLEENFIPTLATVPGIDVILAGHSHSNIAGQLINGVLVTEPANNASRVSDIRITVSGSGSDWAVTSKSSTTPSMSNVVEDATIKTITQPYHDAAVAYINTPIGTATADFPGGFQARIADGPTADLINRVQEDAAAAAGFPVQASLAALFNDSAKLAAGPIKLKDAYSLYIYDNTLYVIDATGQQIKDELEWTAGYFNQYYYDPAGVKGGTMPAYNYDLWSGIDYTIDVTKPVGQRVVKLELDGQPLAMDQVVRIALNNYRAAGMFPTAPRLYQSTTEVRQLITDWIIARGGTISPSDVFVQNYTLLPPPNTWLSTTAANPVTRTDYAGLLWTAFDQSQDDYLKIPSDKGNPQPGDPLNREGAFWLLGSKAMENLKDIVTDMSVLNNYTDAKQLSSWAKNPAAYLIQEGIFIPTGGVILPKQTVTNAEALALVREARYPLFTFLSTNDLHGNLETGTKVSNKLVGGEAYNMTYINQNKALNPLGTLLLDAGDMMQGTPISNWLWGASVIDVMNHMGYNVATVGNHEFDWGQTVLQERMAQAEFPFVVANIFNAGTDTRPSWAVPTVMFTVKNMKIGVVGVTSKDTPSIVMAGNCDGLEFRPVGPIVTQYVAELRAAGANIVVVLAHMPDVYNNVVSGEMLDVAVPGVDLIISGHSHSGYAGKVNGIPIIQEYSSGTAIGVSNLSYDRVNHTIANATLKVVTTYNDGVTPDAGIATLVAYYTSQVAAIKNVVKATTLGPISRGPDRYTGEVPMGDLIADGLRWKGGAQIGFINPGGIRADIIYASYPHDITYGDFFTVQPFDNKLTTLTMTGSQLYALLEQQFGPTQSSMKLLQESGLKYSFNLSLPVGSRILNLQLEDGTPIAKDATPYKVATINYLSTGGDLFSAFLGATNVVQTSLSDVDVLVEYVQSKYGVPPSNTPIDPSVYPKIEGRITNVTP